MAAGVGLALLLSGACTPSRATSTTVEGETQLETLPAHGEEVFGRVLSAKRRAVGELVSARRTTEDGLLTELVGYQTNDAVTIRGVTIRVFSSVIQIDCQAQSYVIVGERFYSASGELVHSRPVENAQPYAMEAAWRMVRSTCDDTPPARDFRSISEFVRLAESYPERAD